MIDGNLLLVAIYLSGCIVAIWICGNKIKKSIDNDEEIKLSMIGCISFLSWIAVIILLTKYKNISEHQFIKKSQFVSNY